jgi:hypothetical protein
VFEYIHRFIVAVPRVLELAVGARPVEGYGGGMCCDVIVGCEGEQAGSPVYGEGHGQGHFVFSGMMREVKVGVLYMDRWMCGRVGVQGGLVC